MARCKNWIGRMGVCVLSQGDSRMRGPPPHVEQPTTLITTAKQTQFNTTTTTPYYLKVTHHHKWCNQLHWSKHDTAQHTQFKTTTNATQLSQCFDQIQENHNLEVWTSSFPYFPKGIKWLNESYHNDLFLNKSNTVECEQWRNSNSSEKWTISI